MADTNAKYLQIGKLPHVNFPTHSQVISVATVIASIATWAINHWTLTKDIHIPTWVYPCFVAVTALCDSIISGQSRPPKPGETFEPTTTDTDVSSAIKVDDVADAVSPVTDPSAGPYVAQSQMPDEPAHPDTIPPAVAP